jgi:formate dehydrogenase subunit delta
MANVERLVTMINQISTFFDGQGDHASAVASVADHISRFWEPRMHKEIQAHVANGGEGLMETSKEAVLAVAAKQSAA